MNQSKSLHGDEPTDKTRERNSQPPSDHFKSLTSYPKTSPVVLYTTGRLNHHTVDNSDVDVYPL